MVQTGKDTLEAAIHFGVAETTVRNACVEFGVAVALKKKGPPSSIEEWSANVDWTRRDSDIAISLGLTRERVRQVRNKVYGKKSEIHHASAQFIAFKAWADTIREKLTGKHAVEISNIYGGNYSVRQISQWCRRAGIVMGQASGEDLTKETIGNFVVKKQFRIDMDECWEMDIQSPSQYPKLKSNAAHITAFELFKGPRTQGKMVLHKCDNRKCVNPAHLYEGTAKDNAVDRARNNHQWCHRLSAETVTEIRRRHSIGLGEGKDSIRSLADEFGFSYSSIWQLIKQRTHVIRDTPADEKLF